MKTMAGKANVRARKVDLFCNKNLMFMGVIVYIKANDRAAIIGAKCFESVIVLMSQNNRTLIKTDSKIAIDCKAISGLTSVILA